jgi:hypothetical protein
MKIRQKRMRLENLKSYKEARYVSKKRQEEMVDWIECWMEGRETLQASETPVFIRVAEKRHNFRASISTRYWLTAAAWLEYQMLWDGCLALKPKQELCLHGTGVQIMVSPNMREYKPLLDSWVIQWWNFNCTEGDGKVTMNAEWVRIWKVLARSQELRKHASDQWAE